MVNKSSVDCLGEPYPLNQYLGEVSGVTSVKQKGVYYHQLSEIWITTKYVANNKIDATTQ